MRVGIDGAVAAERLSGAVRIPTISVPHSPVAGNAGEEGQAAADLEVHKQARFESLGNLTLLHAYLRAEFPKVHGALSREVVNQHSLLYKWPGADKEAAPILLLAHLDVVPADAADSWTVPPFEGRVDDTFIWGRGTLDDKVSVCGILEAIEFLVGRGFKPQRDIYLAFGGDEEVSGLEGAKVMAARFQEQGLRFEFIIDEGLSIIDGGIPGVSEAVALVGTGSKGYLTVKLTATGEPGHSSIPPTETAVGVLSAAIAKVQANPMPAELKAPVSDMLDALTPNMGFGMRLAMSNRWLLGPVITGIFAGAPDSNAMVRTTGAPTVLRAGSRDNVLPQTAEGLINFRIHPSDSIKDVMSYLEATVDDPRVKLDIQQGAAEPFGPTSPDSTGYRLIKNAVDDVYPEILIAPALFVAAADIRHYAALSDQLYLFHPLWLGKEDRARIHGIDERISIDHYRRYIEYYVRLIQLSAGK